MKYTQHYNPVRLVIGSGVLDTLVKEVKVFGNKCLLVVQDNNEAMLAIGKNITDKLTAGGVEFDIFCDIRANPLMSDINMGIKLVKENKYAVIVAVGGGSVIDTAKILSISNNYEIHWKSICDGQVMLQNKNKLPLISIPTTAGTGSHCTQAAIISDDNSRKHSVYSSDFFSAVALIDSDLTMSLPPDLTASTGFDAFCHLSESYINGRLSPITEVLCMDAMKKATDVLPKLVAENKAEYREIMSIIDSCAGISLSNGGANIPHAFGEAISSCVYRVNHGSSLALLYPSFVEHYYEHTQFSKRVKEVIEIINHRHLIVKNGKDARRVMEGFIESLHLKLTLAKYEITLQELAEIKKILENQKRFPKHEVSMIIKDISAGANLTKK